MPTCLPHRQAAASRSRRTHGRRVLELLLGDGDIAATAVMHQAGSGASVIEVHLQDGACVYREVGGRVFKPLVTSAAAPTAAESAAGAARAASDAAGSGGGSGGSRRRATHRALLGRTPLVKHLDWLALRGTGGASQWAAADVRQLLPCNPFSCRLQAHGPPLVVLGCDPLSNLCHSASLCVAASSCGLTTRPPCAPASCHWVPLHLWPERGTGMSQG
jgi:hypothetical protein